MEENKKTLVLGGLLLLTSIIAIPLTANALSGSNSGSTSNIKSETIVGIISSWSSANSGSGYIGSWNYWSGYIGSWNLGTWSLGTWNKMIYSEDLVSAYNWAYEKWIISESSIEDANLYDALTNLELADIMNKFTENVLWYTPDTSKTCSGNVNYKITSKEQNIIKKSCQFWLIDVDVFNKRGKANRAIFGTALSRALWWDKYEGWNPYYKNHLEALKAAWIMNQINNPESRTEIKWYVLTTLMKATEWYSNEVSCDDPAIKLACQNPEAEVYETCPQVCIYGTLINNLKKTVEFKANEVSRKAVFDGTYTALKDHSIGWITMWLDDYYSDCDNNKRYNDITFHVYINWEEVEGETGSLVWHSCLGNSFIRFDDINVKKWKSIQIKIEWELNTNRSKEESYSYRVTFNDSDRNTLASAKLAQIKIVTWNSINLGSGYIGSWNLGSGYIGSWDFGSGYIGSWDFGSGYIGSWNLGSGYIDSWSSTNLNNSYTSEMVEAYQFAYENWITTASTIEKAKMYSTLTRWAMAKMLANYAINVLWQEPDTSKWEPQFNDVTDKLNQQYDNAITLAYQLWIMWQNIKSGKFRPYANVTRAEFVTALSRMLYGTEDGNPYYVTHFEKLKEEWIINSTGNPYAVLLRWYAMLMLMRSAQ